MNGRRVVMGSALLVGARLAARMLDLVAMLILARLLVPADFGIIAVAMTLVSITEAVFELPVNQVLLRLEHITRPQYDTAFTLGGLRGFILALLLVAVAWPFARFYGDGRLTLLICLLSLGPAARGMISPRLAEFQKEMSFWRDLVIELGGKAGGIFIGLSVAFTGGNYWAIASITIASPLIMMVISYVLAPFRPRLALSEFQLFWDFLGWTSAAQIITAINWQSERLLLGKLQTASSLGLFTTASDLSTIPMQALFGPIVRPLLTVFASLIGDREKLAHSYKVTESLVLILGIPLLVGECLVAEPLVLVILGEKWRGAIPLLRWLAVSLVPALLAIPAIPLVMALGKTRITMYRSIIDICFKLPIVVFGGIWFGFWGIILARFVSEVVCAFYGMRVVRDLIGITIRDQAGAAIRPCAATLAMALAVSTLVHDLSSSATSLVATLRLVEISIFGAVVYASALSGFWLLAGRPTGGEATIINAVFSLIRRSP